MSQEKNKLKIQRKTKCKLHWFRVVLLSLFVLGIGAEISLRVLYQDQLRKRVYPLIYQPHPRFGYTYIPGIESRICVPSICKDFSINSQGYYGPEFDLVKTADVFRIAIVAPSNGTGIWLDGVENYAIILQRLFDEQDLPIEVLIFSVDGAFRDLQQIRLIQESVIDYKPDLVLLYTSFQLRTSNVHRQVYKNYVIFYTDEDGDLLKESKASVDSIESHLFLISIYDFSYVVRAGVKFFIDRFDLTHEREIDAFIRKRYSLENEGGFTIFSAVNSARILIDTQQTLANIGAELLLFSYAPEQVRDTGMSSAETSRSFGIPYLELDIPRTEDTVHRHDSHYNAFGHQLIAEGLFRSIAQKGYLIRMLSGYHSGNDAILSPDGPK